MRWSSKKIAMGGITAAIYVVVTIVAAAIGLSSGVIQFRISEAMCVLPMFYSAAIPGLTIGCLIANIIAGGVAGDIIFGSIATLIGAIGARLLRKHRWVAPIPTVVANAVIVPFILRYAYHVQDAYLFLVLTVGVGELVCAYILGEIVINIIRSRKLPIQLEEN